jgi:hypothetical protein
MSFKLTFLVISLISSLTLAQSGSNTVTCQIDPTFRVKTAEGRKYISGAVYQNGVALNSEKIEFKNGGDETLDLIIGRKASEVAGPDLTEDSHYRLAIKATLKTGNDNGLDVYARLLEKNQTGDYEILANSFATDYNTAGNSGSIYLALNNPKSNLPVIKKGEDVFSGGTIQDSQRKNYLNEVNVTCKISK